MSKKKRETARERGREWALIVFKKFIVLVLFYVFYSFICIAYARVLLPTEFF
jgi:hypothetical protein